MTTGLKTGHHQHADMRLPTKARVDAQAMLGRALAEYGEACELLGKGEVLPAYEERKLAAFNKALQRLVEAAQAEGAGEDDSQPRASEVRR